MTTAFTNVVHVIHSSLGWQLFVHAQPDDASLPAQIILSRAAIPILLSDFDPEFEIHEFAGLGVPVTITAGDLPALDIDWADLPAYLYAAADLHTALTCARWRGLTPRHWL